MADSLYSRHVPRQKPPKAVDVALKLLKAERRPPTAGDAFSVPWTPAEKSPRIEGQLRLFDKASGGVSR